jgi:hypothetical protein
MIPLEMLLRALPLQAFERTINCRRDHGRRAKMTRYNEDKEVNER